MPEEKESAGQIVQFAPQKSGGTRNERNTEKETRKDSGIGWTYDINAASAQWGDKYPEADGSCQSPINLLSREAKYNPDLLPLECQYGQARDLDIVNNGRCLVLKPKYIRSNDKVAALKGGPLPESTEYELIEIRFHWGKEDNRGSEHTVNFKSYPMEMQLIHLNTAYNSLQEAYTKSDGVVISAMFVQTSGENCQIKPIIDMLPNVQYKGDTISLGSTFNTSGLLPDEQLRDYWTYKGSLTEPPCYEGVTWILYRYPYVMSHGQVEEFRRLRHHVKGSPPKSDFDDGFLVDNFRQTQNQNGRNVYASFET